MLEGVILYHRVLIDNSLIRVMVDTRLIKVLLDIRFTKNTSRERAISFRHRHNDLID